MDGYSNLSLAEGDKLLLDNLDIPDKGTFQFEILVDFNANGLKKLQWRKSGGSIMIKRAELSEFNDFKIPVFKDISEAAGLITEATWKYGGPTIADIDNNGYYDLILNNHDKISTQLFLQKEKGKLVEQELFPSRADFHGTAAGDFDNDGDLDIVNSIGGGNGTNPKPPFFLKNENGEFFIKTAEVGIAEGARGRSVRWIDMDLDGDLDLLSVNAEGINSSDSVQHVFYENNEGQFEIVRCANIENAAAERVLVTDINNDQIDDLVMYSPYSSLSVWKGNGDFTFTDVSEQWLSPTLQETGLVTGVTDIDIDNDGDLDLYLARGKVYYDLANKSLDFDAEKGRVDLRDEGNKAITAMEFEAEGDIILSGIFLWYRMYDDGFPIHLGSQKDTFTISEMDRLKVTPEMAKGWPAERKENGWYLGHVGNGKWQMEWVRNKAVYWGIRISIDGVKKVTPIGWQAQNRNVQDILLENNNRAFSDVSESWNIPKGGNHQGVTVGDFNNDGHNDLYVYRFGFLRSRVTDWLLMNSGKGNFEITTSHTAKDINDKGHGDMGQAFDFDLDGDIDLLNGSDNPGKWYLYANDGSKNNYVLVRVGYSEKEHIDPYSAIVIIKTADGIIRKRVGSAGEIHSQSLLNAVHVGLGKSTTVEKITVRWRNGETAILENPKVNHLHDLPIGTEK